MHLRFSNKGLKGLHRIIENSSYIKTQEFAMFTPTHVETARRQFSKRKIKTQMPRVFCDLVLSKKPLNTRMGRGRGKLSNWFAPMQTGKVLFEIPKKFTTKRIKKVYKKIAPRLPVDSKLILKSRHKSRFFISAKKLNIKIKE